MSETAFPANDLLRRRLQTSLIVVSLATCVASTLFLLLFAGQIGLGISFSATQNRLTVGLSAIFSQFMIFMGVLVFAIGAVIVSFVVFLMMAQRVRDFGLMKATGCPNGLVFSYFFTELLLVTVGGCIIGILVGFAADYAVINMGIFQAYQKTVNFWFAPIVFVAFLAFALIFGAKPMFDAAKMSPVKAISPVQYYGLTKGNKFEALSKFQLTFKIASRSLFRRQSATVRTVISLSIVFVMLTVSIAGSVIARDTTSAWVENAMGQNVVLIAHSDMGAQYMSLLEKFSGVTANANFNYSNPNLALPDSLIQKLNTVVGVVGVDPRLVTKMYIQEISNFTIDTQTGQTVPIGDSRKADPLVIGVEPAAVVSSWFVQGRFFTANNSSEGVIGDSVAQLMFDLPLSQSFDMEGNSIQVVGTIVDPINNGLVVYVPLEKLESVTGLLGPNIILVKLNPKVNRQAVITQLQEQAKNVNPDLVVFDLNIAEEKNLDYLGSIWSVIMSLPLFCLTAAAISLTGFIMLSIDEQHQEFAVLRAIGVKPKTVVAILSIQSLIVLLSSCAIGISFGTIITLLILIPQPLVTTFTILEIAGWLLAALTTMFLVSLYPALNFARKPPPRTML